MKPFEIIALICKRCASCKQSKALAQKTLAGQRDNLPVLERTQRRKERKAALRLVHTVNALRQWEELGTEVGGWGQRSGVMD